MYKTSNICDLDWIHKILADLYNDGKMSLIDWISLDNSLLED